MRPHLLGWGRRVFWLPLLPKYALGSYGQEASVRLHLSAQMVMVNNSVTALGHVPLVSSAG